jgi:hypothetical protein
LYHNDSPAYSALLAGVKVPNTDDHELFLEIGGLFAELCGGKFILSIGSTTRGELYREGRPFRILLLEMKDEKTLVAIKCLPPEPERDKED